MLESLVAERAHGRSRNLVVAATAQVRPLWRHSIIEGFALKRMNGPVFCSSRISEEILRQTMDTYRAVLRDQSFGELLVGGRDVSDFSHLFATIQSVRSRDLISKLGADYWTVVVFDECHHLAASSFEELIREVQPRILLGLHSNP